MLGKQVSRGLTSSVARRLASPHPAVPRSAALPLFISHRACFSSSPLTTSTVTSPFFHKGVNSSNVDSLSQSHSSSLSSHEFDGPVTSSPDDSTLFRPVVIRDSRALAQAIVKYIPDSEVDTYRTMLQTIREHPNIRPLALKKLTGQMAMHTFSEQVQSAQEQTLLEHQQQQQPFGTQPSPSSTNPAVGASATASPQQSKRSSQMLKMRTQWLDQWLLKALDNKRVNLFPLRLPTSMVQTRVLPLNKTLQELSDAPAPECVKRLLQEKAKLAAYLFSNKQLLHSSFREFLLSTEPFNPFPEEPRERVSRSASHRVSSYASTSSFFRVHPNKEDEMIYIAASRLADELGDALHVHRLQEVNRVVKQYVEGDLDNDKFLIELSTISSLHMDLCTSLIEFLDVEISPPLHELIQSRRVRRQDLINALHAELSYIVYLHSVSNSPESAMLSSTSSSSSRKSLDDFVRDSPFFGLSDSDSALSASSASSLDSSSGISNKAKAKMVTVSFGNKHMFEIPLRVFPKSSSTSKQLPIDLDSHLHFQSSIKTSSLRRASPRLSAIEDDLEQLVRCVRSEEVEDLELIKKDEFDGRLETPPTEAEILTDTFASPVRKIFLDNLPHGITEEDIRLALRKCGKVQRVFLYTSDDFPEIKMDLDGENATGSADQIIDSPDVSLLDSLAVVPPKKKKGPQRNNKDEMVKVNASDELDFGDEDEDDEDDARLTAGQGEEDVLASKKKASRSYKRVVNKSVVLKGSRTDNYAFVVMEDDESFARMCSDPIRIFGININGQSCKTYKVHDYHNFRVEMDDYVCIKDIRQALNVALEGKFETYLTSKISEAEKPAFVNLTFNNHADAWKAFHMIYRSCSRDGLEFLRPVWIRTQRFYKLGNRAKSVVEQEINERELMGAFDRMRLTGTVAHKQQQSSPSGKTVTPSSSFAKNEEESEIDVMNALNALSKQHQHSFE